jgi:hypothetical protein
MSPGKVYNQQLLEQNQMHGHGVNNLDLDSWSFFTSALNSIFSISITQPNNTNARWAFFMIWDWGFFTETLKNHHHHRVTLKRIQRSCEYDFHFISKSISKKEC